MLDAYPVVKEMRAKHPKLFDILTKVQATYERIHYERSVFHLGFFFFGGRGMEAGGKASFISIDLIYY